MVLVYEKFLSSIFNLSNSFFITIVFIALINGVLVKLIEGSLSKLFSEALAFNKFITEKESKIKNSKKDYKAAINDLYEKYSYNPLYKIIEVIPFLIQVPFLISVYLAILNFFGFQNLEFLYIKDLSQADGLFYNYNLLPIIMFFVSMIILKIDKKRVSLKNIMIPVGFLILLYSSPSSLIIYWILSQIIVFLLPPLRFSRKVLTTYILLVAPFFLIKLNGVNDIINVISFLMILLLVENILKGKLKFLIIPFLITFLYVIYFHDALMIVLYELNINYNGQPIPSMWRIHFSVFTLLFMSFFLNLVNEKKLKTFCLILIIVLLINPPSYEVEKNRDNLALSKLIKEKKHSFSLVLIVLDEYVSPDELNNYMPLNTSYVFSDKLKENNWIVKNSFYSNSTFTNRSINSLFNYGEDFGTEIDRDWSTSLIDLNKYYNSKLIEDLKNNNIKIESYGLFNFNSSRNDDFIPKWEYENSNRFRNLKSFSKAFSFLDDSEFFFDLLSKSIITRIDNRYKIDQFREDVFKKFKYNIISENDFVYYHFHLPHSPFRYKDEFAYRGSTTEDYIRFWNFTSDKFSDLLLDLTLNVNAKVIVIGDHGFRSNKNLDPYNTFGAFYGFKREDLEDVSEVQDIGKLIKKYLIP